MTRTGSARISRRSVLTLAAASAAAAACDTGSPSAAGDRSVVVDSWGGDFQQAQADLIFTPFQQSTGVEVVQLSDGENMYAKVRAQAGRDVGEIDLVHGDASWLMRGKAEDLWARVDPAVFNQADVYDDARDEHGLGILYWSFNIVYHPDVFPTPPTGWSQLWEHANAHPGRVALFSPRPNYVIEVALMADGVPVDQVYPLTPDKIDRAYRKLDEIQDKVSWYEGGGQGGRLFESGQVDIGMFYGGDGFGLDLDGTSPGVVWEQGLYTRDYWLVPANAPHPEHAFELLAYALAPERQAEFAERTGYGPVVGDAAELVTQETRERLTSVEPQRSQQLSYDYIWWGMNDDEQLDRWTGWLRG